MRSISYIVPCFLGLVYSVTALSLALEPEKRGTTPSNTRIQADLGPKLCKGALIYFPSSPEFGQYTKRWSTAAEGDILVVVVPSCDNDVAATVKFANSASLPFLAINQGHGFNNALGSIKHGILIKLQNLNSIDVAKDGKTAKLGGGVYTDQLIAKLAEKNKVAATGSCGCVGIAGPGLGGGFGKYMGYAGLISDNIVSMDVVTADGSQITVSASSHPELYWGMRGAGHNYGIVTNFVYKIFDYPRGQSTYYVNYIYSEDKLEAFFQQFNKLLDNGNLERNANTYAVLLLNPAISPKPLIIFEFYYFGTALEAKKYLDPFLKLSPLSVSNATTLYKDLARALGTSDGDPLCVGGTSKAFFPVGLKVFNIETNRKIYELFLDMVTNAPQLNGSFVQFEGFSLQGMKAIDPASSAYAHRDDNILVSWSTLYPASAENDALAVKYGHQARELWVQGETPRRLTAYSNYAYGDETLAQVFGYETWRLERLKALKKKWDPNGKFNFYNPIR